MVTFKPPAADDTQPGVSPLIEADEKQKQYLAREEHETFIEKARRGAKKRVEEEEESLRRIVGINGATIIPRRTRWLWAPGDEGHGRIPIGELTLIVGKGDIGKSTLLAEMAAWITTGRMHGEFWGQPKAVMYVANEDSLECTVVPRLIAAGADLTLIDFVGVEMLDRKEKVILPSDCDGIAARAKQIGAAAIMLDPLSSNLRADTNKQKEVRAVVEIVRAMAEDAGIAAIGLAHTRKAVSTNLMDALIGSVELGNVCRSAMGAMIDPDDDDEGSKTMVLSQEKNNLGRSDIDSYRYQIVGAQFYSPEAGEFIPSSRIQWLGRTPMKVSDMLADSAANGPTSKHSIDECSKFIRDLLSDHKHGGECLRGEVVQQAGREGFSRATVDRAARRLKLTSRPSGHGASRIWCLPVT